MNEEKQAQGHRRRLVIMDSQLRELRNCIEYLFDAIGDLREQLIQFRADRKVCGHLGLLATTTKIGSSVDAEVEELEELEKEFSTWH